MSDAQASARGHRAFNELEEVNAAFDKVRERLIAEMIACSVGQDAKILKLHAAVDALAAVRQAMQSVIDNGRVADAIAASGLTRPN